MPNPQTHLNLTDVELLLLRVFEQAHKDQDTIKMNDLHTTIHYVKEVWPK